MAPAHYAAPNAPPLSTNGSLYNKIAWRILPILLLAYIVAYIDRGGPTLDPRKALADVFWSLLGSAEFVFNH